MTAWTDQRAPGRFAASCGVALLILACLPGVAAAGAPQDQVAYASWARPDMEHFLESARLLGEEELSVGVTGSRRATLSDGRVSHRAHIQTVNLRAAHYSSGKAHYLDFRDSYKYNIAAYRVSVLVGYDRVPVSVERKVGEDLAAVTWWVDDVAMMETDRQAEAIIPPNVADFFHQLRQAHIFAQLISNVDLNTGNLLITDDWDVWSVDFTRSFRRERRLQDASELEGRIDRRFLEGMRSLTYESLEEFVSPYLTKQEIRALLERRDRIVDYYDHQIVEHGEVFVVCDAAH